MVTATPDSVMRRLGAPRQLVSHPGTAWKVTVEVASTADAKSIGTALADTELLMDKASSAGIDIGSTAPTIDSPKLKVEVTYTVTQAANDSTVTMPTAAELKQTAVDVMGAGAADPVVSTPLVTVTLAPATPSEAIEPDSATSLSMPFGLLTVLLVAEA